MDEVDFKSPLGTLHLTAGEKGIQSIRFTEKSTVEMAAVRIENPHLALLYEELRAYFAGHLTEFTCSVTPEGTDFQKRVWKQLTAIPFGRTKTYGQIAKEIDQPNSSRAVGGANNRNPIPIVIPCHRVVGASNALVGFASGLWRKQWMLEHEGVTLPLGE
ncbi:methylated-DNA-(protein)-cysteine S-methyltransferase [Verrucomicrobiia bacterium DG1235]|nr:methylated-DNA-(protein)-cysteine S-methyltransferase [Verrucomicrobiae bacterium DG1235]